MYVPVIALNIPGWTTHLHKKILNSSTGELLGLRRLKHSIYNFPKVCVSACTTHVTGRHRQNATCVRVPVHYMAAIDAQVPRARMSSVHCYILKETQ